MKYSYNLVSEFLKLTDSFLYYFQVLSRHHNQNQKLLLQTTELLPLIKPEHPHQLTVNYGPSPLRTNLLSFDFYFFFVHRTNVHVHMSCIPTRKTTLKSNTGGVDFYWNWALKCNAINTKIHSAVLRFAGWVVYKHYFLSFRIYYIHIIFKKLVSGFKGLATSAKESERQLSCIFCIFCNK